MSFIVSFNYNEDKKSELQELIDSGSITFNYDISCDTYTKNIEHHDKVIDGWIKDYGKLPNGFRSKIENMRTSTSAKKFSKRVGIADCGSRKYKVVLLCFNKPNDDGERAYSEMTAVLWLNSDEEETRNKIFANTEELAELIIARGNNEYVLE